jgi:hypothetical protein
MRRFALGATIGVAAFIAPVCARAAGDDATPVQVEIAKPIDQGVALVLERVIDGTNLWESVCVGTCEQAVPRGGQYRVNGHGVRPSPAFALAPDRETVHLDARVAYKAGWTGGVLLTIVGPLTSIVGGLTIALQQQQPQSFQTPCTGPPCPVQQTQPSTPSSALTVGGAVTVGVGVVMTIAGIVAILSTDHTTVHQRGVVTFSARSMSVTF